MANEYIVNLRKPSVKIDVNAESLSLEEINELAKICAHRAAQCEENAKKCVNKVAREAWQEREITARTLMDKMHTLLLGDGLYGPPF